MDENVEDYWAHLCFHVFGDRLTPSEQELLQEQISKYSVIHLGLESDFERILFVKMSQTTASTQFLGGYQEFQSYVGKVTNKSLLPFHNDNLKILKNVLLAINSNSGNLILIGIPINGQ